MNQQKTDSLRALIGEHIGRDDLSDMDWVVDWVRENLGIDDVFSPNTIGRYFADLADEIGYVKKQPDDQK